MSYDYLLVKGKAGRSLETLVENAMSEAIGTAADVKASISRLYPSVRWNAGPDLPGSTNMSASFGSGGPAEFQLTVQPDGQVRMITMSRCERSEVERVARELGLVALDEQSMDDFDG